MSLSANSIYFHSKPLNIIGLILKMMFNSVLEPMSVIVYSEGPGYFEVNRERDIVIE